MKFLYFQVKVLEVDSLLHDLLYKSWLSQTVITRKYSRWFTDLMSVVSCRFSMTAISLMRSYGACTYIIQILVHVLAILDCDSHCCVACRLVSSPW